MCRQRQAAEGVGQPPRCPQEGQLGERPGQQRFQRRHRRLALDRTEAGLRHSAAIVFAGHGADMPPVPPVDHLDRVGTLLCQVMGEGVLEGAAGGIVALPGRLGKALQRREEQHEIQRLVLEHLGQAYADIHLGGQAGGEPLLIHPRQALILQLDRCVHHAMDRAVLGADLRHGLAQRRMVAGVGPDVARRGTESGQFCDCRVDLAVLLATAQPDHLGPTGADQVFAPQPADAAGAADHQVDAPIAIEAVHCIRIRPFSRTRGSGPGRRQARRKILAVPDIVAASQRVAVRIGRQRQQIQAGPGVTRRQVHQPHAPVAVFLGHGADQSVHAGVRR